MAEGKEIEVCKPIDFQSRLKEEQEMLEKYFWPEKFPILDKNNEYYFERTVKLRSDRIYKLRVYMNSQYPDSLPDLVVCDSPEPMPHWSGSHATHTWPPKDGFLHICHWHRACWTRKYMIYHVFNKGEEWLVAYEKYLQNGKSSLHLEQMQLTEDEKIKERRNAKHAAFALCQDPVFLNQSHKRHLVAIYREILSQRSLIGNETPQIQNAEKRTSESAIPRANHNPTGSWLVEKFRSQCTISESHHMSVTDDEIRNAQQKLLESVIETTNHDPSAFMIEEIFRLQCVITECRLVNPGCIVNVSLTQTDGQISINAVTPTLPQSLQSSDKYSNFMIKHY